MLAYGYKYGEPWAEDRRVLEWMFYKMDQIYGSADRRRTSRSGSLGSGVSATGRHWRENNESDDQLLADAMGLVRIDKDHDSNTRHGNSESRSLIGTSSSLAIGNRDRVAPSYAGDGYRHNTRLREERYGGSHSRRSVSDYRGKGMSRAVGPNVGGRVTTHSRPEYLARSHYYDSGWRGRDAVHTGSSADPASWHYSRQLERNPAKHGSYRYAPREAAYDTYRGSIVSPDSYSYDSALDSKVESYDVVSDDEGDDFNEFSDCSSEYSV